MLSTQTHGGEERDSRKTLGGVHLNKPLPLVLKHIVTLFAVLCQDGIQAGLSGDALPTTIKEADEIVTDLSDQVTMEANLCHVVGVGDAGVLELPVPTLGDGGVHQGFDLTHGRVPLIELKEL